MVQFGFEIINADLFEVPDCLWEGIKKSWPMYLEAGFSQGLNSSCGFDWGDFYLPSSPLIVDYF